MNLRSFLFEIDKISKGMSVSELQAFIHEHGRTLPEHFRKDYIDVLKSYSSEYDGKPDDTEKSEYAISFQREYEQITTQIEQIASGELCIGGELNYEYDDWYDNGDEFILSDPDCIADIILKACEYVHSCVDREAYALGYQLAECLMELEINVEIEDGYGFYDPLRIKDLEQYEIGDIDYKSFVIDGLYCGYLANDMKNRADVLYEMIDKSGIDDISLEMLMQNGEELTDIEEFLPEWIKYLGKQDGRIAQPLLKEALELFQNEDVLLDSARRYYDLHPSLYEQYIDGMMNGQKAWQDISLIGDEALEKIDAQYVIRSRIAKKVGLLSLENNQKQQAGKYLLEAFRSDTNVTNFMAIYLLSDGCDKYIDEIRKIYHGMYTKGDNSLYQYAGSGERMVNRPDVDTIYTLAILGGEYQYVIEHVMNKATALGWTFTFMKCGLAVLFLMLYDGDILQPAGREMCQRVVLAVHFDKGEIEKYTGKYTETDNESYFWRCFLEWKQNNRIDEAEKQKQAEWLDKIIKKRVEGIMEANRRNYYGECASFVAALGETLESWGNIGAKQRVLLEYKQLYSRRSAFHQELRKFGMLDTRKKK